MLCKGEFRRSRKDYVEKKIKSIQITQDIMNKSDSIKFINNIKEATIPFDTINFNKKRDFSLDKHRSSNERKSDPKVKLGLISFNLFEGE